MKNIYRHYAHNRCIGWSTWHLEWCTKYRYKIFGNLEYKNLCTILLYESAKRHNFTILDCEVDKDHVHVVASLPLTMTPVDVVHHMKGYTSKCLFRLLPKLRNIYFAGHIWSPGKFIGSVGHITLERAKEYLEAHHAKIVIRESRIFRRAENLPAGKPSGLGGRQFSPVLF